MRPPRLIEVKEIPLDDIDTSNRLRPVSETAVKSLTHSIEPLGLQSEIQVRKIKKTGKLRLIAGGHRIAAFRALGHAEIPAKIWDCTEDWADLAEIDDNLAHAELDFLEKAVFFAPRKEVYEKAYPETKQAVGTELAAKRWNAADTMSVASFVTSTADKMGVDERTVRRLVAAGRSLGPREIQELRDAPKKVSLSDLQEIAKCCSPTDRYDICRALGDGSAKSAKEVLARKKAPGTAVKDPIEAARGKLNDAYARAPKEARRRFVDDHRDELLELLGEEAPIESGEAPEIDAEIVQFSTKRAG
ncbi:ParB/RepB/Spo0J family partition protein [Parasedimentitalea psychrophila]|uniref:ParB N-terminal domain-containing protein n=1 Tax=Parasedimentitalea psychrophila TaxID=2997337 RepID=A0A9Y2KZ61_9RHOB|nr:ParB N-terminal domain-containing protein [Parasedimentitalea psychrophila]WIY25000.1 ParB N-terminal domain-containing protein [Parasedimentitalea psychrophila]